MFGFQVSRPCFSPFGQARTLLLENFQAVLESMATNIDHPAVLLVPEHPTSAQDESTALHELREAIMESACIDVEKFLRALINLEQPVETKVGMLACGMAKAKLAMLGEGGQEVIERTLRMVASCSPPCTPAQRAAEEKQYIDNLAHAKATGADTKYVDSIDSAILDLRHTMLCEDEQAEVVSTPSTPSRARPMCPPVWRAAQPSTTWSVSLRRRPVASGAG